MLPVTVMVSVPSVRKTQQSAAVAALELKFTIKIHQSRHFTAPQNVKRLVGVDIKQIANHFRLASHSIALRYFYRR